MSGLALICSGQGTHSPDMLEFAAATESGLEAISIFGRVFERDLLAQARSLRGSIPNSIAQPLTVATALANWASLESLLPRPALFCGYSAGETAAWGCAGAWTVRETAEACRVRCCLMDGCAPAAHGMVAVRGLPLERLSPRLDASLHIAIVNGDDHAVVAGPIQALHRVQSALAAQGIWTRLLNVQVPSHTPFMQAASSAFAAWLSTHLVRAPAAPVMLGISGQACTNAVEGAAALARAISEPIQWRDCMQRLAEEQIRVALELGPGNGLAGMLQQAHPAIQARSVSDFRSPSGVAAWVARHLD